MSLGARLPPLLAKLRAGGLAFDASVLFGGFSLQLLTQIGWLVLAVRFLGPDGYGLFASLTAVTVAAACFVGCGCDQLLVRHAAAEPAALRGWIGHSLIAITLTGLPVLALGLLLLPFLEIGGIGWLPLLLVLAADLLLGRYAGLCTAIYMASGQAARQSTVTVLTGACRLGAIALAGLLPGPLTIGTWAAWYAGSSAVAALLCLGLVVRDHGMPQWRWMRGQWGSGFTFGAEAALQASAKDLDKPIVLEFAGAAASGYYAAAFRIIDTLSMPIRALGYALVARMFRMAAEERAACVRYGLKLLPLGIGLGAAAGLGLAVFAGLLPWIFGAQYAELPWLVRLIAPMPAFFAAYLIGADVLSAIGRQSVRLGVVCLSLALTLLLCWLATPAYGIAGAALARLAVQAATAALVWALVLPARRKG
ncbi:lipopolysaccharide biosynthesis protein [Pseudoroseomonas ludipueritiae]|uniref:Oligosaccharide flippase family protein n=1 Tax=Pseudoroseomonas ludipueritiae TaxID=198093 RepID=A0ABR7R9C7_9PROT|nr:oligosaccharide flippase family protein [Pseudoroseomonas ludipueritiae]MBC9178355.1 oligosaccharide flippase family protein [Pseudoroseomonas ludipueritiae]